MELVQRLKQVVVEIERLKLPFSLAGGLVASLYRQAPRATADIDIVILTDDADSAKAILRALDLTPHALRQADLEGGPMLAIKRKNTPVFLLSGRAPKQPHSISVDLILSSMPWVLNAIERASPNRVDFGFDAIPCLTLEDLILSKLYSFGNQPTRFMDLDDLRSIFESKNEIDWTYLLDQINRLKLLVPPELFPFVPQPVLKRIK